MSETVTDIIIEAHADDVWRVLSDLPGYGEWNPYIRSVSGKLEIEGTLAVTRFVPNQGENTIHPTVTFYRPGRQFCLRERPALPGLLDTEHEFKIEPLGSDRTRFVQWQRNTGLLAPIFNGSSDETLRGQLEAMNHALKARVEQRLSQNDAMERIDSRSTVSAA